MGRAGRRSVAERFSMHAYAEGMLAAYQGLAIRPRSR
jgi:hypothetical protein